MKTIMLSAATLFLCAAVNAQTDPAPGIRDRQADAATVQTGQAAETAQRAAVPAETGAVSVSSHPAQYAYAAAAGPAKLDPNITLGELKKKHASWIGETKTRHSAEIKALKESLRGKPSELIREEVKKKKESQKVLIKAIEEAAKKQIKQFKNTHQNTGKKGN